MATLLWPGIGVPATAASWLWSAAAAEAGDPAPPGPDPLGPDPPVPDSLATETLVPETLVPGT